MDVKRLLAAAAIAAGLAIGLAANAQATPEEDFWQCVADHQDTDGIGVCCVFYGGTYDEKTGECWDYPEATAEEPAGPTPKGPIVVLPGILDPGRVLEPATPAPVLPPVSRAPTTSVG
jgi:nitrite reductase/ring-hydroxylating ferredoxin subunit